MSALDGLRNVALDLVTRLADKSESGVELTLEDWRTLAILVCDAVFDESASALDPAPEPA